MWREEDGGRKDGRKDWETRYVFVQTCVKTSTRAARYRCNAH